MPTAFPHSAARWTARAATPHSPADCRCEPAARLHHPRRYGGGGHRRGRDRRRRLAHRARVPGLGDRGGDRPRRPAAPDRRAARLGRHRRAGGAGLRRRGRDGGRRGGLRGPPGHGAPAVRRGGRRAAPRARHAARDLRHRAGPGAGGRRRPGHRQGRGLRRRCCSRASPGWRPTWSSCCRSCCSSASRRAAPTRGWPC